MGRRAACAAVAVRQLGHVDRGRGAGRAIVGVRDALIAVLRQRDARATGARGALDPVNAALSLVAGVEYPATGIQRSMLEQALRVLRGVLGARGLAT